MRELMSFYLWRQFNYMHTLTTSPTPLYTSLVNEVDRLMKPFSYTRKDLWYGWRRTFDNGMWFDLIDYRKKEIFILRVGRGVWLVRQHPILQGYFDNVSKVIAKMEISDVAIFEQKNIVWLFTLLDEAPRWVGVLHD